MLKLRISGYYKSNRDKKNYNNVEVMIPDCEKELILGNVINRVVPVIFSDYTDRGKCHIDKVTKDAKIKPSFSGKNIKEMEENELQDLAIAYNLSEVPLCRAQSLWDIRQKAYRAYCNKVLEMNLAVDFDYAVAEDVIVGKASEEKTEAKKKGTSDIAPEE